jgi:1,4-alpha-glucan branching enzyme
MIDGIAAAEAGSRGAVVVAPFDTELFGHWWFEGSDFLGGVYRELAARRSLVRPTTAKRHLDDHPTRTAVRMPPGSWGANGDFSMWLGPRTSWTWERLWPLEERFWDAAPAALMSGMARDVLAQAAREMLLAQSSDWQFIISTGAAADYAEQRFQEHCAAAEQLVSALSGGGESLETARGRAAELAQRNAIFPDILPAVSAALGGSRSFVLG